jgi:hypothetical protein
LFPKGTNLLPKHIVHFSADAILIKKLKDKHKTSGVDSERCLILQTLVNEVIRETASPLMSITKYLVGRPSLRELARLHRVE